MGEGVGTGEGVDLGVFVSLTILLGNTCNKDIIPKKIIEKNKRK